MFRKQIQSPGQICEKREGFKYTFIITTILIYNHFIKIKIKPFNLKIFNLLFIYYYVGKHKLKIITCSNITCVNQMLLNFF